MSEDPGQQRQPTQEELRAMLDAELDRITVDDVVIQTIVTLVNVAGRRLGLAEGSEQKQDLEQGRLAIESIRALLPLIEDKHGSHLGPVRDALTQLQMAYAKLAGAQPAAPGAEVSQQAAEQAKQAQEPGPAQRSGKLWVPGD